MQRIYILLISLFVSFSALATEVYPSPRETLHEKRIRATWDEQLFTNPAEHNPSRFMYIVHKLNLKTPQFTVPLLTDLNAIQNKFRICTSVISQKSMRLYFGSIGFILKVPEQNIGPMHHHDMASRYSPTYEGALAQFRVLGRRFKTFLSPQQLIEKTESENNSHNEVNVLGSNLSTNTKVEVAGILIECGNRKETLKDTALIPTQQTSSVIERCVEEPEYKALLKSHVGEVPFVVFE